MENRLPRSSELSWSASLLARACARALRIWASTWRIAIEGPDPLRDHDGSAQIGAVWHRSFLIGAAFYRDLGFIVPISRSRDGALVARVARFLGWAEAPRGSSSRGGSAVLLETVRRVRGGETAAILCDGPRGPARVSKPGAVALANTTGRPLIPVAFSAKPCLRFRSWDRTLLPWPFAKVIVRYGDPIEVRGADDDALRATQEEVDAVLNNMTDALDARLGLA